jgi:hypothetical protein
MGSDWMQRYLSNSSPDDEIPHSIFADSTSAAYTGYQQAWRMLGFFVDCSYSSSNNNNGGGDNKNGNSGCTRYLLWAAYVDPGYEGGGIDEYAFFDPEEGIYDTTYTCDTREGHRCVKMDCHDPDTTTWKLMGLFKNKYYGSEWMEQLFKHEGVCVWGENGYKFMKEYYNSWPEGCSQTKLYTDAGDSLYIELEPSLGGMMNLALYTDSYCREKYQDPTYDEKLSYAISNGKYVPDYNLETWNTNMNTFKYCQPCVAYTLNAGGDNKNRRLEDGDGEDDENHQCDDEAGYTNVNQCMKFRSKTTLLTASIQDLVLAHQQGGIAEIEILGNVYGYPITADSSTERVGYQLTSKYAVASLPDDPHATPYLIGSTVFFMISSVLLVSVIAWKTLRYRQRQQQRELEESLIPDGSQWIEIKKSMDQVEPKGIFS